MSIDGPDQIIPTENYVTTKANGSVKIRENSETNNPENLTPMSLVTFTKNQCEDGGNHVALVVQRDGLWVQWTYSQYLRDIRMAAKAFIRLGLEPHHGVAVWGFNAPEWFISDIGCIFAGGMAVGLYPTNSMHVNKFILEDSRANILVVEEAKNVEKILEIKNELPDLKKIVQFIGTPDPHPDVISWKELIEIGAEQSDESLTKRQKGMAINHCATLVYTSGTTGMPKGVMISHDNIRWCSISAKNLVHMRTKKEVIISYLPLSHVAANLLDIWVAISGQATVYFADKMALKGTLINTLREARPTIFLGVPRVWEKLMEGMQERGKHVKGLKKKIVEACKKAGLDHHLNGRDDLIYFFGKKFIFKAVKEALGLDRCHLFFSGAAPITMDTLKYFLSIDIPILELFGMSETTGPHTMSYHGDRFKLGSVGKTLSGHKTRISDPDSKGEGEILMWGRNIMMGYLNREDKTSEDLTLDGWMKSGDQGILDENGFLYITGRIKELLITAGGENVAPVPIEEAVKKELPCISNAILIGDKKKFLTMFLTFKVTIDEATEMPTNKLTNSSVDWCKSVGSNALIVDDILGKPDVKVMSAIQDGINRANVNAISNAARIQRWTILPVDVSVAGGELGPTLKLKRFLFNKKYEDAIEKMYL